MKFLHQVEPYLSGREKTALAEYLDSGGWLTEFEKTRQFEALVAEAAGVAHAAVLTNGTVGLYLALKALGVGPGDRVVVPNYTMIATVNAVVWAGAEPVLADVDPATLCLDLGTVPDVPAKAMIYVEINGRRGDMEAVSAFCRARGMALLEDSCQALGSSWNGRPLGSFGAMGVFSFTPHKIITTGQGGAVVTDDPALDREVRRLKDFCRTAPATDQHDAVGFNFKFTDLQAVVGIEQIRDLAWRIGRRREVYGWYRELLAGVPGVVFPPADLTQVTPWFVDPLLPSRELRDGLAVHLKSRGIGSRPYYPPVNAQPVYARLTPPGGLPMSEDLAVRGLWLPSSIGLPREDVERVCVEVRGFMEGRA